MFDRIIIFNLNSTYGLILLINHFAPKIDWNIRTFNSIKYPLRIYSIGRRPH